MLSSISGVSPINLNDRRFFNELCWSENSPDYSNSYTYLIQSTFFGGWKYADDKNFIALTTRFPGRTPFVISKMVGRNALQKAIKLAFALNQKSGEKVIFKNVGFKEEAFLKANGCTEYGKRDYWDERFKYDEDTFPEAIAFNQELLHLSKPEYKNVRYHLRKLIKKHDVSILPFTPSRISDALKILASWKNSFKNRFYESLKEHPLDGHSMDLHDSYIRSLHSACNEQDVFSYLLYLDGEPKAFSLAEKLSSYAVGLYSNISTNDEQGLSEAIIIETLRRCNSFGFSVANLGGSEFSTLHEFKKKFASFHHSKKHLVLY